MQFLGTIFIRGLIYIWCSCAVIPNLPCVQQPCQLSWRSLVIFQMCSSVNDIKVDLVKVQDPGVVDASVWAVFRIYNPNFIFLLNTNIWRLFSFTKT